jgi:hypothetical protein
MFKYSVLIFVEKNIYKMQHLEGSGTPVLYIGRKVLNPLNLELNLICYLLALLRTHHFLHVSRIRVKLLTFRLLMSYIYIYIYIYIYDISRLRVNVNNSTQHCNNIPPM